MSFSSVEGRGFADNKLQNDQINRKRVGLFNKPLFI